MSLGLGTSISNSPPSLPSGEPLFFDVKSLTFVALALVTAIPLLFLGFGLPLAFSAYSYNLGQVLWPVIAITGVGHVAATSFYYADRGFAELVRANRARFYVWPLLAVAGACIAFELGRPIWNFVLYGFIAWQLWHFQRQNYGIAMLAARSVNFGALPANVNPMLNIAVIGGVAGLLSGGSPLLHALSIGLFLLSTALLCIILWTDSRLRRNPQVLIFLLLGWAFFMPTLWSTNPISMAWSYAIGHGAQYLILIAALARRVILGWVGAVLLGAVGLVAWFLAPLVEFNGLWSAAILGFTVGHFLIDAKSWRMREQPQNALLRKRLDFLFS